MKKSSIYLLSTIFLLTGCPIKPDVDSSDHTLKKVWRVGLTKCEIEKDPAESVIGGALVNFGVNFGLSYIKNAISNAATDKEEIFNVYSADYLTQIDRIVKKRHHRKCIIIGSGLTKSIQRYKSTLSSSAILPTVDNISGIDQADRQLLSNDVSQLGITSDIHFLARIGFTHSANRTGVKPFIKYLYYPKNIFERNNSQSMLLTIDGKAPNEEESSKLSVSLKIPKITPSRTLYKSTDLIHVENIAGWMLPPEEWKETDETRDIKYTGLINLEAKMVVSSPGSKFWKKISSAISDNQLSSLGEAISKQILTDPDKIAEQEEAEKQAAIQGYLDALATFKTKNAALQNTCESTTTATQADRTAAYFSAFAAYKKAKLAYEAIKKKYGDEDIPDIGSEPQRDCPQ